ncbi:MAG: response regulator [Desulfobacterales bacterium]|nr:response regulator [Desulfobacterales bacterium]
MNKPNIESLESKILIVDDTLQNLQLLTEILTQTGYSVTGAPDGPTALMISMNEPPDLILLDIRMPEMDGYEVCQRLKSDIKTKNIPIIFLSALDELNNKIKGFSLGGADYITKPFQNEEVIARVNTHISFRKMQKQIEEQNIFLQKEVIERRKAEEALKKVNDELEIRIHERTIELLKAKDAAEAASHSKSQFLANISHEFKTPLNSVIGFTVLLQRNVEPCSDEYTYLNGIKAAGWKILAMVDNLIELCQIETNGIQSVNKPFELRPLLKLTVANLAHDATAKGLKVKYHIDAAVPDRIIGDSKLLKTILDILGKNAVKFTEKGEINISVCNASEAKASLSEVQFSIIDTGVGIPSDRLEKIFEDFTQADNSDARRYGGIGLGLTMVRRIVGCLGGRIWVESIEAMGTKFHFTLQFII